MEKIKNTFLIFLLSIIVGKMIAQDSTIVRKGLIRAQLTISPSYMFSDQRAYFYLHGNLEGYVSDRISLAGEGYYNLGDLSADKDLFNYNHSGFFGASYHFTKKNNDLYVGLQPGLSFTKLSDTTNSISQTQLGINPLFSPVIGYNFYVNKVFHFFIQSRLVIGQHNYDIHKDLSEFRFSAGLGFNINMIRMK